MTDDRTTRILDAAEELFLAHGLRGTTMEAVARAASVAKPTLYSRYAEKEALFSAVGSRAMDRFLDTFEGAIAGPGSAPERVMRAIAAKYAALTRMLGTSPHAAEIMAEHARLNPAAYLALQDGLTGSVAAVLSGAGIEPARERARLVLSALDGVKAEFPDPADFARLMPLVVGRLIDDPAMPQVAP